MRDQEIPFINVMAFIIHRYNLATIKRCEGIAVYMPFGMSSRRLLNISRIRLMPAQPKRFANRL